MTRQEAIKQTTERWLQLKLNPEAHPLVFSSDVDITVGCTCFQFYNDLPHTEKCVCYVPPENPELNQILNAELGEQFRNGTIDARFDGYDA